MKKFLLLVFAFLIFPYLILASDKVEINTASLEQLDELTGIGPAYAQRIIDARPFSSVDDLIRVSGIGEKTLQKIKDQGLAYVENQVMQPILQTPIETPPETPREALAEPLDVLPIETPLQDVVVPIVYSAGIIINEILPSPEGPDAEEEWIEIYNTNNFEADLSGWKIKDKEGTTTNYILPENTKILAYGYLVLKRPDTKITLNNTTDGLTLYWPNDKAVDSLTYETAPNNQSYNRVGENWQWSATLTPGSKNIIQNLSKTKKSDISNKIEAGLTASINNAANPVRNGVSNGANPWFLFFTAIVITIISAAIVLLIKIRFGSRQN